MTSPLRRRVIGIAIVAVVVVVLLAAGLLYLYTSTPLAKVTIEGGTVTIEQGTIDGKGIVGVIGVSPQIYGGSSQGYPLSLTPGASFAIGVALGNRDNVSHDLDAVHALAPFGLLHVGQTLPITIPPGQDFILQVGLTAPSSAGDYNFNVTLVSYS